MIHGNEVILFFSSSMLKFIQNNLKWLLSENVATRFAYTGTKISSKVTRTKDETLKERQHDIVYYSECPGNNYNETGRRLVERVIDPNERDTKSHIYKHAVEKNISHLV